MATLYLPDVRQAISQLATGTHADGDQVASYLQDWFASLKRMSPGKWNEVRTFYLTAAMCYPVGDKERLSTISEWIVILFAWDDLFDVPEDNLMDDARGAKAINNVVLSIFDTPETSETQAELTVVAKFRAFWARFRTTSTPTMQKRFVDAVRRYARGTEKLVHNREQWRVPSMEEFVAMRRATSAVEPALAGVEYTLEIEVPNEAFYHAAVQELRDTINDIASWTNDYQNLVAVVAVEKKLDVQSAIQFVFVMIQSAIDHYFEARKRVPKFDPKTDDLVSRYIRGIECFCSGSILWHFEVDRYFGSKSGEVEDRLAVKMLPREKNAPEPGFQLEYKTPSTVIASVGDEMSVSKNIPDIKSRALL
ncbi:hypothetical protein HO133_007665 [Letharia lupina]|uniref:Terpene synthase n=1 Tax=Letharia lupina TaxID=560253 RepID=A0A8H6CQV8_9LECA|nr:uncharacterized protein HO133_007665 [Letharia lupina]KAF6227937.1 hypothetical protein HO133_007665 [Letharia lupina]